jgi:hypothetical protein
MAVRQEFLLKILSTLFISSRHEEKLRFHKICVFFCEIEWFLEIIHLFNSNEVYGLWKAVKVEK